MALSDVQELSSLLRTEDLEKSELNRKKLAIDLAIKQQEGRLCYECDERDRCLREISFLYDNLHDVSSTFELKEIEVQELGKEIQRHGTHLNLETQFRQFQEDKTDFPSTIDKLLEQADQAVQMMEMLERNPVADILKKKSEAEAALNDIHEDLIIISHSIDESTTLKSKKEEDLITLDAEMADISAAIDRAERTKSAMDATLLSEYREMERLKAVAAAHKSESAQEDFKYSAELGKKAEAITAQRDKIKEEEKTTVALEKESSDLTLVVEAALKQAQSLHEQLTQTQQILEQERRELVDLQARKGSLQQAHASLMSELAAANHLCQTVAMQSFKSRADDLAKELQEINIANDQAEAERRVLEEQLADNSQHTELRALQERLISAAQDHTISQERRGLLRQELEERQVTHPALLAEKLTMETRLVEIQAICAQATVRLQALQVQVQTLTADQASREPQSETQERIAALESAHSRAVEDQVQHEGQTRELQSLIEQRTKELASLQQAAQERNQAAITAAFNKDKLKRVASAKECMLNLHRQAVAKLRKLLMDEDKQFQAAQQQERADHDAAMSELAQEKRAVDAALAEGQMELTQLQQELAEDAPLLPESQLPAAREEYVPSPPGPDAVTAPAPAPGPALEMLAQRSQLSQSQSTNLPKTGNDASAAAGAVEVSNKRAKHMPTETVPPTTAAAVEATQSQPVAVRGKKNTKKKRKL